MTELKPLSFSAKVGEIFLFVQKYLVPLFIFNATLSNSCLVNVIFWVQYIPQSKRSSFTKKFDFKVTRRGHPQSELPVCDYASLQLLLWRQCSMNKVHSCLDIIALYWHVSPSVFLHILFRFAQLMIKGDTLIPFNGCLYILKVVSFYIPQGYTSL